MKDNNQLTIAKLKQHHKYAKYTYDEDYSEEMLSLRNQIQEFVQTIEDAIVRDVIYYRYVVGESWDSIACIFKYAGTPDCYRRMSERYLKKCFAA